MAFSDWIWLVRLIIEILKLIAALPAEELRTIANLRSVFEIPGVPKKQRARKPPDKPDSEVT